MKTTEAQCQGCDQTKTVPLIPVDEDINFEGICDDCEKNYGMQVGDMVRLRKPKPGHESEIEVMFVAPDEDAIRIRYSDGLTELIGWDEFARVD